MGGKRTSAGRLRERQHLPFAKNHPCRRRSWSDGGGSGRIRKEGMLSGTGEQVRLILAPAGICDSSRQVFVFCCCCSDALTFTLEDPLVSSPIPHNSHTDSQNIGSRRDSPVDGPSLCHPYGQPRKVFTRHGLDRRYLPGYSQVRVNICSTPDEAPAFRAAPRCAAVEFPIAHMCDMLGASLYIGFHSAKMRRTEFVERCR